MARGGYRPGAGRKSNGVIARVGLLFDSSTTEQDWQEIIRSLVDMAKSGERAAPQAARFLFSYRFGVPTQEIPKEDDVRPIEIHTITAKLSEHGTGRKRRLGRGDPEPAPGSIESMEVE